MGGFKLNNSSLKSQIIDCGIKASIAGAIFLIAIYFGANIIKLLVSIGDVVFGFLGSIELVVRLCEIVGGLHFSIHVIVYTVFAWSFCVWWKVGAFNPDETIKRKSFASMTVAFCIAYFVFLTGRFYQPTELRVVELMVGIAIYLMYSCTFFGLKKKKT